ncbi:hypothetical protein H114_17103 [Streptomyces gancidicus BKS 13-15]|uniref:Uncharacterized protein n=1 Tax=Streptomyces gancidicus BKS 13-15 TaxID=1284664 RepID=M3DDC2_STREZ|nr:hypothetical protein H114_17103 [Streptomyces gancidicus BKS 13-15]
MYSYGPIFRYFATPFTKDMFGETLLPLPTWEWTACSITPTLLIWLARRPTDWATLSAERTILRIALTFHLLYGLAGALLKVNGFSGLRWSRASSDT